MWVAELGCAQGHGFEGWFGSRDDFDSQRQRGLVSCPQCGSADVERRLTAPRLNLGASPSTEAAPDAAPTPPPAPGGAVVAPGVAAAAQLREFMARLHARAEDVGQRFAEEARRIHAQEAPERAIRGQATAGEVEALLEDGIEVLPLPFDGTEPLVH